MVDMVNMVNMVEIVNMVNVVNMVNMVNGAHQVHLDNQMLDDLAIDPDLLRLANTKTLFDLYWLLSLKIHLLLTRRLRKTIKNFYFFNQSIPVKIFWADIFSSNVKKYFEIFCFGFDFCRDVKGQRKRLVGKLWKVREVKFSWEFAEFLLGTELKEVFWF